MNCSSNASSRARLSTRSGLKSWRGICFGHGAREFVKQLKLEIELASAIVDEIRFEVSTGDISCSMSWAELMSATGDPLGAVDRARRAGEADSLNLPLRLDFARSLW